MNIKALGVAVAWVAFAACVSFAHASLSGSTPPPGAVLEKAPEQLVLRFTEAVELVFSRVVVYDAQGREQARPQLSYFQPPLEVEVPLRALPEGTYTVAWKVTSAVDGHVTKGAFPFAIGTATQATALAVDQEGAGLFPIGRLVARWFGFAGMFGVLGAAAFFLLVVRDRHPDLVGPRLWQLVRWSALLSLISEGTDFVYQSALTVEAPFWQGFVPAHWVPLLGARYGQLGALRMGLALLACVLAWGRSFSNRKALRLAVAGVGLAVSRSLSGHSAALSENALWAVGADVLHLIALGAWLGGLVAILWLWPKLNPAQDEHFRAWTRWLPRFSNLALACALTVVVTGFYNALAHVPRWDALWTTEYGRSLLAKGLLFLPMVLFAVPNLLRHVPALRRAASTTKAELRVGQQSLHHLRKHVGFEVMFAGVILFFGSLLTLLPPAGVAEVRANAPPFVGTQVVDYNGQSIALALSIAPAQVGPGQIHLSLTSASGASVQPQRVRLRLTYLNQSLGSAWVTLDQQPDGAYGMDGSLFSLPGVWRVQVQARFAGKAQDLEAQFEVNVADAQGNPGPQPEGLSPEQQAALERGKALYQSHCMACHGETGKGDGPAAASLPTPPADISAHLIHQDRDVLVDVIENGFSTGMPAFGAVFKEDELNDLVDYLRTLEESGVDY